MGAAVSNWELAKAVSLEGDLGVVSGTALDSILARRLQMGDIGGHMKRALDNFPVKEIAEKIYNKYFIEGGKKADKSFKNVGMFSVNPKKNLLELTVVGNFVEVFLAKEGHNNPVGINYLEKIQLPNLASIYGAMLAGVDYVLMGAGIPREIPGVLDKYVNNEETTLSLNIDGSTSEDSFKISFNPKEIISDTIGTLKRPKFLAIIASNILAITLSKKATGKVDGFIIEGPTAGGHNASPRGKTVLDDHGEPIYGEKDVVNLDKIKAIGLPFYLAGSYGKPGKLQDALDLGAVGTQVGTAFAFCKESGVEESLRLECIKKSKEGTLHVFTDALASPTGFPFKVALLDGTNSDEEIYKKRPRICDLGYLRTAFKIDKDNVGYRCGSEEVADYVRKGGTEEGTVGKKCLCNSLLSNIGQGQYQSHTKYQELALLTAGDDAETICEFIPEGKDDYTAKDVLDKLKS